MKRPDRKETLLLIYQRCTKPLSSFCDRAQVIARQNSETRSTLEFALCVLCSKNLSGLSKSAQMSIFATKAAVRAVYFIVVFIYSSITYKVNIFTFTSLYELRLLRCEVSTRSMHYRLQEGEIVFQHEM